MTLADRPTATFESLDPATGESVGRHLVHDAEAVTAAVDRARIAAQWWGDLGFAERRKRLLAWEGVLARRQHQLVELIHRGNGTPRVDGLVELSAAIEHLDWAARHARRTLGQRRVRSGLLMANH